MPKFTYLRSVKLSHHEYQNLCYSKSDLMLSLQGLTVTRECTVRASRPARAQRQVKVYLLIEKPWFFSQVIRAPALSLTTGSIQHPQDPLGHKDQILHQWESIPVLWVKRAIVQGPCIWVSTTHRYLMYNIYFFKPKDCTLFFFSILEEQIL